MTNNSDLNSNLNFTPSVSKEMYTTTYSMRSSDAKSLDPSTTFEVFRNNTTAVEVIVKEVPTKSKKTINQRTVETTQCLYEKQMEKNDLKYEKMRNEIEQLKSEIYLANRRYFTVKRDLKCLIFELKKQLNLMSRREIDEQTKSLTLQLENEKLHTLSESQSVIISRLRKELIHMKRRLKFVVKGIAPQVSNDVTYTTDIEYDEFEKGLKKETEIKFGTNIDGLAAADIGGNTFDSTFPSFDKV
ncbi:uncharacterized protein LOC113226654 [Hyposmocoma kahamanoa]|uniref:uncharacterized protein LOC113226654 n=1 Tax=Hyposmocoma kahamanoa TaxID=1477025 RepID=UPI000E6D6AC8|nr:uncharacterized protein LOC113226654 [Hyposmocoma kahamanoa]